MFLSVVFYMFYKTCNSREQNTSSQLSIKIKYKYSSPTYICICHYVDTDVAKLKHT